MRVDSPPISHLSNGVELVFFFFFCVHQFNLMLSCSSMKCIKVSKAELLLDVNCIFTKGFREIKKIRLFLSDCVLQQNDSHLCQIISELHPKKNLKLSVNSDQACSPESYLRVLVGALVVIECGQQKDLFMTFFFLRKSQSRKRLPNTKESNNMFWQ